MSAYKYYDMIDDRAAAAAAQKQQKERALDELFSVAKPPPQEGQIRVRRDGRLEVYTNGRWLYP